MTLDLAAIEKRAETATAGPWRVDLDVYDEDGEIQADVCDNAINFLAHIDTGVTTKVEQCWEHAAETQGYRDATFIANARTDIPLLLARVKELERENAELRGAAQ